MSGALVPPAFAEGKPYPEAAVTAEFIERFTRFIDWPERVMPGKDQPFVICAYGDPEVADYLDTIAAARKIKAHRVLVRRIGARSSIDGCHVLHLGRGDRKRRKSLVAAAEGKPIMTTGRRSSSKPAEIMIRFYHKGRTLRFEIAASTVAAGGLRARAKLLRLGRAYESEKWGGG